MKTRRLRAAGMVLRWRATTTGSRRWPIGGESCRRPLNDHVKCRAWSALELGLAGVDRFGKLHAVVLGTICDPNAGELAAVADRYRGPARFADDERMITEAALDAVVLTTRSRSSRRKRWRRSRGGCRSSPRNRWR